jgi:hypothetical protein
MLWGYDHCTVLRQSDTHTHTHTSTSRAKGHAVHTDINLVLAGDRVAANLTVRDLLEPEHLNQLLNLSNPG